MAIVKIPESPLQQPPTINRVENNYQPPVVDTRSEEYNTLSVFATGSRWACDFYTQVVTQDTAPQAYHKDQLQIYGQYRRIRGFELLVTSPMRPEQEDNVARSWRATGTASVYSVITPNEGDMFIADIGNGQNGLFSVLRSTRNSPFTESFCEIEFRQIDVVSKSIMDDLDKRTVETLYFDKNLLRSGTKSVITTEEMDVTKRLLKAYRRLNNIYVHEFYDSGLNTFILPGQQTPTYDPYMTHFALRILDRSVCSALGRVSELTATHHPSARVKTLLDAVEALDGDMLYSIGMKYVVSDVKDYDLHPYFSSIAWSGVGQVVSVIDNTYSRDTEGVATFGKGHLEKAGVKRPNEFGVLPSLTTGVNEPRPDEGRFIKRVVVDDYYILSEAFYKGLDGQSELERILRARMEHEPFEFKDLADLADYADKFDNLERYYYIPLIIALIKTVPGVL